MHSQCRSNLVWILPRNQKKNKKQLLSVAIFSQPNSNEDQKNKQHLHPSLCDFYPLNWNEDQCKKALFDNFFVCDFIRRYLFYCAIYVFCAIFDHQIRMKTEQIRKKRYFSLSLYGGTLNFPLGEAKSQWEDANYRWEDVSLILLKYWLYFHLLVKPLHHYYNTDTVRNQHQLLTCQTSKWQSLLF